MNPKTRSINITLEALKKCVLFAEKHGSSEFKTVTITDTPCCGIGSVMRVKSKEAGEEEDLTNTDCW